MLNHVNPLELDKIKETIQTVIMSLSQCRQQISEVHLEYDEKSNLQQYFEQLKESQQQFHYIINEYFKDLGDNFVKLQTKSLNNSHVKDNEIKELDYYTQQTEELLQVIQQNQFNQTHMEKLKQTQKGLDLLKQTIEQKLSQPLSEHHQVKVNQRGVEGLYLNLNQYVSVAWPGDITADQSSMVCLEAPQSSSTQLILLDEQHNQYGVYDAKENKVEIRKYSFQSKSNIDYCATAVQDDQRVYFLGGVTNAGYISSAFHVLENNQLQKLPDMIVKRVGCSAIIIDEKINKYLYVIGGKTADKIKTKLCERFNFTTKIWEYIPKMNFARSKCALAQIGLTFYAFFGVDSDNLTINVVEKYYIQQNKWEVIQIENFLPGFDVSDCAAITINQSQILIFGGIRYSICFPDQMYFNRKIVAFNVSNYTLAVMDSILPLDLIPYTNPIIYNNEIYVIGRIMKNIEDKPSLFLDGGFVIKINKQCAKIIKYLPAFEQKS